MIIGRNREKELLSRTFQSNESELITVHGRRRVGKTYLIREYFRECECFLFHTTGVQKGNLKKQLTVFSESLSQAFFEGATLAPLKTWHEAFKILTKQIKKISTQKVVIFLDELPWLATDKSDLLETLEYYWNHEFSSLKNIILVVCGSSASWMIKKIIYDKGGLYNRTTCEIALKPFSLPETQRFLTYKGIHYQKKQLLKIYMSLGGIPYYLNYINPTLSADENIQRLFFSQQSPLQNELTLLFQSLFKNSAIYLEIIILLSQKRSGMKRAELEEKSTSLKNGGRMTQRLLDLCQTGFIEERIPWGKKNGAYYKLIDEFCLFYLRWVGLPRKSNFLDNHWLQQAQTQAYATWSGYAFENVCFKHVNLIVKKLNIPASTYDSWHYKTKTDDTGAQIDLLIDRNDQAITLCEIKYTNNAFSITKAYAEQLKKKMHVFQKQTNTKKQLFWCIISAYGVKRNAHYESLVHRSIDLTDLI